jgi:hypothetical protein
MAIVAVLLAASLVACRRDEYVRDRENPEAQIVAISVQTEPRGATVRVNRLERSWITPCDIADFGIRRGPQDLEVALDGYETITTRVYYDGQHPAAIQLKMRPRAAVVLPAAEEPRPVAPPPVAAAKPLDEPKPAPIKLEAVAGGTRMKIASPGAKVRIQAKTVVSEPERPGEYFLPDVPPDKVQVEFLDAKTDAVIASVEFSPSGSPAAKGPAAAPTPAPKDPVPPDADRVGEVKLVSKTYGVFVKLDPGLSLQPGEEILIVRDGKEVARTKILRVTKGDDRYPDGAAQVQKEGSIQKGDEVRRTKP